jgi:[ribosomal protein S5]-alanine N-acetyltransferase
MADAGGRCGWRRTRPHRALPLITSPLCLRPLREENLDPLHAVYAHAKVERWIGQHTREDVAEELRFHIAHQTEHGWAFWAVEQRSTTRFLGDCGLQPLEHHGPEVELGYDLHPEVGRGLATEAVRVILNARLWRARLDAYRRRGRTSPRGLTPGA